MGLRVYSKREMRRLRDDYLKDNGHNLHGVGELGSSDSEKESTLENSGQFAWKQLVNRKSELLKNPEKSLAK